MTDLADLRARLDRARPALLARDAQRLSRQLAHLPKGFDAPRFLTDLAAATSRAHARAALRPTVIRYPEELPVSQARESLLQAIAAHPVVIVCARASG